MGKGVQSSEATRQITARQTLIGPDCSYGWSKDGVQTQDCEV